MRDRKSDTAHRSAAERKIGRTLRKGEVVDHLNEDKTDQSPINLDVKSRSVHTSGHNKMRGLSKLRKALRAFKNREKVY